MPKVDWLFHFTLLSSILLQKEFNTSTFYDTTNKTCVFLLSDTIVQSVICIRYHRRSVSSKTKQTCNYRLQCEHKHEANTVNISQLDCDNPKLILSLMNDTTLGPRQNNCCVQFVNLCNSLINANTYVHVCMVPVDSKLLTSVWLHRKQCIRSR